MADQVDPAALPPSGREKGGKMDPLELKQIIARELDSALGVEGGKLSTDRRTALEYYEGEPFGNEVDGRSQVVMLSVLEAVEWVLPALLRIFTASDKIANFEPTREQDEAAGEQATDYVSYIFYRDNSGFMLLHDWMKDALIQKVGWVKVFWDKQQIQEVNTYAGLTAEEYDALKTPDTQIIEERSYPTPIGGFDEDSPDPQAQGQTLYDCTLRVTRTEGRVKLENVPPEEVLVSRRAKHNAPLPFVCHRREQRYADLLEQGYDADCLDRIPSYDAPQYNTERMVRYEKEDDFPYQTERTDKPMRDIWIEENYVRVDYDGDGLAELCKVVTAGNGAVILTKDGKEDIEEIDEVPLVPICPVPMPHKLVGLSLADLVMDLQLIKSTLVRQMLDNVYLTNNPRTEVPDDIVNENTYDDLLTSRPGGIIRVKKAGLVPFETPFVAAESMKLVEYFDQTSEVRTGVSRRNQGLNPDDFNKTALAANLYQQAAAQRVELIARIFAETGVKELCRRILGLVTKYQQRERIIRLTGKWVPMDPRQWRNSMEVSVSVGLGTGNRDQILQHLMQTLQIQQGIVAVQKGVQGPLVTAQNIYDVVERLTENAGFKESFFTDPSAPPKPGMGPAQPPPPDPEMVKAQHEMALKQQSAQLDAQNDQARLQADLEGMRAKAALEMQLAQQRAALQLQIERDKAQHDIELERMREEAKQGLAQRELELRAQSGAFAPPASAASAAAASPTP